MRPELDILEQIDDYLSGDMVGEARIQFEAQITTNSDLAEQVQHQQQLIQAARRKVLRAQISNAAVGAAGGGSGISTWTWVLSGIVGIGLITGITLFFLAEDNVPDETQEEIVQLEEMPVPEESAELMALENTQMEEMNGIEEPVATVEPSAIERTPSNERGVDRSERQPEQDKPETEVSVTASVTRIEKDTTRMLSDNFIVDKQNENSEEDSVEVVNAESMTDQVLLNASEAHYNGGYEELNAFIDENLRYPRTARNRGVQGVVKCIFFVSQDGSIGEISSECVMMTDGEGLMLNDMQKMVNRRSANAFMRNARHALRTMPKWIPAMDSDGNPIVSLQNMYFKYDLEGGCSVYQIPEENQWPEGEKRSRD